MRHVNCTSEICMLEPSPEESSRQSNEMDSKHPSSNQNQVGSGDLNHGFGLTIPASTPYTFPSQVVGAAKKRKSTKKPQIIHQTGLGSKTRKVKQRGKGARKTILRVRQKGSGLKRKRQVGGKKKCSKKPLASSKLSSRQIACAALQKLLKRR